MSLNITPENQTLNWFGGIVAMMTMALLFFVAFALVYKEIPQANQTAFATLLGFIGGLATAVVGFFFGSSASNKKQADANASLASAVANNSQSTNPPSNATVVRVEPPAGQTADVIKPPEQQP